MVERKSIMAVKQRDVLAEIRQRCVSRLRQTRKQEIKRRRRVHADQEMLEDEQQIRTVIEEEGMPFDLSIEEMNRVYESIT